MTTPLLSVDHLRIAAARTRAVKGARAKPVEPPKTKPQPEFDVE